MQSIIKQQEDDDLPQRFRSVNARSVIFRMADELTRPGRKGGGGFYEYPENQAKHLWAGLAEAFPLAPVQPAADELRLRLLTIAALESARCFEDGVITNPIDADLGSVMGIGYPSWTGGVLSYIDTVGTQKFVNDCLRFSAAYGSRFTPSPWLMERARTNKTFYATQP
eukprot:TRINITY_DN15885_c0_g1_i1.p1 TRINITY_DN15885_c0_g1~~TRINITY_DN15885_c0_g1_i1.p1  ORF type:complete len:168 (-),score=32.17 TRINITY_DN15885_c0_g1_i1:374-877(-)